MTPTVQNLEMARGDTLSFDFTVSDLAPGSITSVFFSAKRKFSDKEYLFRKSIGDGVGVIGENAFRVRVAPEDTANIDFGNAAKLKYDYDLQLGIGEDIMTPLAGRLTIFADVTVMQYDD